MSEPGARRRGGPWLRLALGLATLGVVLWLGRRHLGEVWRLREAALPLLAAMLVVYLATRYLNSEVVRVALLRLGHPIGRFEAYLLTLLVTYTNLLVPRAGLGTPAVYLKRRHGVRFADFTALLMPMVVLQTLGIGLLGTAVQLVMARWSPDGFRLEVCLAFAGLAAASAAAVWVPLPIPRRRGGRLGEFLRILDAAWRRLGRGGRTVGLLFALQVGALLLRGWRLQLAFLSLGEEVGFWRVLVASLLGDVMMILAITPSGLGLREAAIAYGAGILGTSPGLAVTAAIVDRIVWTLAVVAVAQVAIWRLFRRTEVQPDRRPSSAGPR